MGGPYKLKKRGKPMTTIYDAAILLVDDNPDLLTLVTDNLRTAGYKSVCTAADCAAARAAFAAHRPDLMILDINLPDGDGFGLFRAHGGTAAFARNAPRGAEAVLVLPVTEDPDAR